MWKRNKKPLFRKERVKVLKELWGRKKGKSKATKEPDEVDKALPM
jgi:hypothetical protein